jgi:aminoglycoside 3-N-acetyltransferase
LLTANVRGLDPLLLLGELAARQIYWRSPRLVDAYHRHRGSAATTVEIERARLRDRLEQIGVRTGALVMLHSSVVDLALIQNGRTGRLLTNPLAVAAQLIQDLRALVGPAGTLTMPTHPRYDGDPGFMHDKSNLVLPYDVQTTLSTVGLLNNLFLRRTDVLRSRHPLSAVAGLGPLTGELLRDNLNEERPLPHGVHSPYYRFCLRGGLIVSLGRPLMKCMTAVHVAEEVRDDDWPVRDFFYERRFVVRDRGSERVWTVRERRPEFVRCLGLRQLRRDLLREGVLHESTLGGLRLDWANARDVFELMAQRNRNSTYPYYFPRTALL